MKEALQAAREALVTFASRAEYKNFNLASDESPCTFFCRDVREAVKAVTLIDSALATGEPATPSGLAEEFERAVAEMDNTIEEIGKLTQGKKNVWLLVHEPAIRRAREKAYADFANAVWSIRNSIRDALRAADRGEAK